MKQTVSIGVIAAALVAWSPSSPTAAEAQSEGVEVFTAQIPEAGSDIAWGQAVLIVDEPIEEVLSVVRDYGSYVQFVPHFTKSRILAQRGGRAMIYVEVSVAKGAFTLWGQLNLADHPAQDHSHVVEALLVEGNIDAFSARWVLTPVDGGTRTRVDFKIYVDPDIPLPSSIFSRENEKAAARMVRALRMRVVEGHQESS